MAYDKLKKACELINDGVDYIATHCDIFCPTPKGPVPDIGSMIKMIEATTGKLPKRIFGKPNAEMIDYIIKHENIDVTKSAIIGDRLHTDIKIGEATDMKKILVLSRGTTREGYEFCDINVDYLPK